LLQEGLRVYMSPEIGEEYPEFRRAASGYAEEVAAALEEHLRRQVEAVQVLAPP
jgi:hypothetical protein